MNPSSNSSATEDAIETIKLFRVPDLQAVLEFARLSRQGNKRDLFERCKILICSKLTPQLINKIHQVNLARINSRQHHHPINHSVVSSGGDYRIRPPIVPPTTPRFDNLPAPNLIQNVHLPFYDRLRTLECINIPVDWHSFSPLRFILNDFDIDFIMKGLAKVFIRISPTALPDKQNDVLPPYLFVQCNNQPVINNNIAKIPGSAAHAIVFPTDITDKLILKSNIPNTISYFWLQSPLILPLKNLPRSYTLKIQIVRCVSLELLVDNILKRELPTKSNDHNDDNDIEIEDAGLMTTRHRVSLICPITQSLIRLPAKSSYCSHLTCFDLRSFLLMNQQRIQWTCPLCKKPALYENLCVDKRLQTILSNIPSNCSTVEIDSSSKNLSDCHYIIDNVKHEQSASHTNDSSHQDENDDDDDDDDDDESTEDSPIKCRRNSGISDCITVSSGNESRHGDELDEHHNPSVNSSMPMTPISNNVLNQDNRIDERRLTTSTNQSSKRAHSLGSNADEDVDTYWQDIAKLTHNIVPVNNNDNNQPNSNRKRSLSPSTSSIVNQDDSLHRKRAKRSSSQKSKPGDIEIIVLSSDTSDDDDHHHLS